MIFRLRAAGRVALLLLVSLALLFNSLACDNTPSEGTRVVVTIYPLADFVSEVAGDKVEVITLLPPGASPHTYELTTGQVAEATRAKLLIVNGAGLDFWVEEKIRIAAGTDLLVLDTSLSAALEGLLIKEGDTDEGHDHGGVNPHIWLNPVLAQKQVQAIAQALTMIDPDNRDFYLERAENYVEKLKGLDEEIETIVQTFEPPEFVSLHPAWTYFARRYGLTEAAVIQKSPGQEPSTSWTRQVIDLIDEHGIRAIFAEPQSTSEAADTVAAETGAEVIVLDPIGGPDITDRDSYINLMRYNVRLMQEAMG